MAHQGGLLPEQSQLGYQNTLMYGHFTKTLADYAKDKARRLQEDQLRSQQEQRLQQAAQKEEIHTNKVYKAFDWFWNHTFAKLGEDWIFLGLLGILMAFISFFLDYGVRTCYHARIWLYNEVTDDIGLRYLLWIVLPIFLILFSAGFVHLVAPQAIGSGVPEVKTILRGVALAEFLTLRTLVAKVIGLTATLGSGIPLGKEAPFVHVASIIANQLSNLMSSFQKGVYEYQSRKTDMLAAACAVGLASCFAAPIGGLLYSIEVTSVYFAVRNYSRGFFAAVICVVFFRLLAVWVENEETLTALYETYFTGHIPFELRELIAFALMGVVCGVTGAFYVWLHRQFVFFMRRNKLLTRFLQKNRFLYPGIVALLFATVSFPPGLGQYMAAELDTHHQIMDLFTNFTWTKDDLSIEEAEVVHHWVTDSTDVFASLCGFCLYTFVFSIIGATVAIPSGNFIPVFKLGAGFGRICGESMHLWFPTGLGYAGMIPIVPGGYATVGAAAFTGAVTHSLSVAVIVVEMTGQLTFLMPIIIATLISNAIAALLQPSLYESMILIKKLPYLPVLLPYTSGLYRVYVEAFMVRDVKFIWHNMTYQELIKVLNHNRQLRGFPLVDSSESMILLGSVNRFELVNMVQRQIGAERRMQEASKRLRDSRMTSREEVERKLWKKLQRKYNPYRFSVQPIPSDNNSVMPRDRFRVIPADINSLMPRDQAASTSSLPQIECSPSTIVPGQPSTQPMKSILKNVASTGALQSSASLLSQPGSSTFTPVTSSESKIRLVFDTVFRKSVAAKAETHPDRDPDENDLEDVLAEVPAASSPRTSKKVTLPTESVVDMTPEEKSIWEKEELRKPVDFDDCSVDPAPFQLVEKTSLMKCHSLFSLVGVNHAYVTAIGRLIGVVGLAELRKAIEDSNAGNLHPVQIKPPSPSSDDDDDDNDDALITDSFLGAYDSSPERSDSELEPESEHIQGRERKKI